MKEESSAHRATIAGMRDLATITRLITLYPPEWQRWCDPGPEGCACRGCLRVPGPLVAKGYALSDRLTEEEFDVYLASLS